MARRTVRWPWGIGLDKRQARRLRRRADRGCDCKVICSMGPTCPGAILARLDGAGCHRVTLPGLHACEGCGLELDGDDSNARCDECPISPASTPEEGAS